jgi:hypothetical protein
MIVSLIVSGVLAASARPIAPVKVACDVAHLTACSNTNVLLGSSGVSRAMHQFLGRHANDRVSYLYANGRLIAQIGDVLGGPPDDRRDLPEGGHLFTACRPHSCMEKGAVAFDTQGRITAVGVLNFHCGRLPKGCSDGATLDLFVRGSDKPAEASRAAIVRWATAADDTPAANYHPFQGVVSHRLAAGR